jgi:enoyl-[acyl-carrier protein] reductase/trans-2-enoyl-CoA reductase (NAD+)
MKAVVTQASSAIPVVPPYISLLFRVMKDMAVHEDCLRQIDRLFRTRLYGRDVMSVCDAAGRLRVDDWELREDVQDEVRRRWSMVNSDNVFDLSDLPGFRRDVLRIFGFDVDGVNYEDDVPLGQEASQ